MVLFWNIDHCILYWRCWWTSCWTVQDTDHIEASCVIYVEVGTHNLPEHSTICLLTVTTLGIAMLTVHHDMMFSICIMFDPRDFWRQTSADVLSDEECTIFITETRAFDGRSLWFIPVNKHTTSDRLGANRRTVGNLCNRQLCATGFILCRMRELVVTHAILS